jgi:MYXO-CTERM domain-containing protein
MSTGASSEGSGDSDDDAVPVAPDRPVVDGRTLSPEELREEVEELRDERVVHIEELRAELGDTVEELASRFDVPARVQARKEETVAAALQQVDQLYRLVTDKVAEVRRFVQEKPGAAAGAAAALLLLIVLRRRRRKARSASPDED